MIDLLKNAAVRFREDRSAAGALEYALLVSFIAVAVIGGATTFGANLSAFFTNMATKIAAFAT